MYGPVNKPFVPWHDHDPCHTKNTLPGPSDKHLGLDLVPIPVLWLQTIGPIAL